MKEALLALFLAACSAAPPRPLPAADWAQKARISLDCTSELLDDAQKTQLKSLVGEDLRTAGAQILTQPQDPRDLRVVVGISKYVGTDAAATATAARGGEELAALQIEAGKCVSLLEPPWSRLTAALPCIAREIAAQLLESKPLAAAMARGPAAAAAPESTGRFSGKLAVLELRNFTKDLTRENAQYFTDLVRTAALKAQPQLEVMTRENLLVLLQASGKDLANCEGECEVDTGRRIGADQIVSGEIQKLGTLYKLSLRLHDTREGRLRASAQASGKTIEELDADAQRAAQELLR